MVSEVQANRIGVAMIRIMRNKVIDLSRLTMSCLIIPNTLTGLTMESFIAAANQVKQITDLVRFDNQVLPAIKGT